MRWRGLLDILSMAAILAALVTGCGLGADKDTPASPTGRTPLSYYLTAEGQFCVQTICRSGEAALAITDRYYSPVGSFHRRQIAPRPAAAQKRVSPSHTISDGPPEP